MDSTLMVPADLVSYLRSGLFGEWGYAAEDIANRALESGANAPEGAYDELLHVFEVIRLLLDAVGWRTISSQSDVVINLNLGGALMVKALKREYIVLVDELEELPKKTTSREIFDIASARVEAFDGLIKMVEEEVKQSNPDRPRFLSGSNILTSRLPPRRGRHESID